MALHSTASHLFTGGAVITRVAGRWAAAVGGRPCGRLPETWSSEGANVMQLVVS